MPFTGKRSFSSSSEGLGQSIKDRIRLMNTRSASVDCSHQVVSPPHPVLPTLPPLGTSKAATNMEDYDYSATSICQEDGDSSLEHFSDATEATVEHDQKRTNVIDMWRRRERESLEREKLNQMTGSPRAKKVVKLFSAQQQAHQKLDTETEDVEEDNDIVLDSKPHFVVSGELRDKQSPHVQVLSLNESSLQAGETPNDNVAVVSDKETPPLPPQEKQVSPPLPKRTLSTPDILARRNISGVPPLEIPSTLLKDSDENHDESSPHKGTVPSPRSMKKQQAQKRRAGIMDIWAQREKKASSPSQTTRRSPASVTANFFDLEVQAINESAAGYHGTYDNSEEAMSTTSVKEESAEQCTESPGRRSLSVLDRWKKGMIHTDDFSSSQENSPLSKTRQNKRMELAPTVSRGNGEELPFDEDRDEARPLMNEKSCVTPAKNSPTNSKSHESLSSPTSSQTGHQEESQSISISQQLGQEHKVVCSPLTGRNLDETFASVCNPPMASDRPKGLMYAPNVVASESPTNSCGEYNQLNMESAVNTAEVGNGQPAFKSGARTVNNNEETASPNSSVSGQKKSGSVVDRWIHLALSNEQNTTKSPKSSGGNDQKKAGRREAELTNSTDIGDISARVDDELVGQFNHSVSLGQYQAPVERLHENSKTSFAKYPASAHPHSPDVKRKKLSSVRPDSLKRDEGGALGKPQTGFGVADSPMMKHLLSKISKQEEEDLMRLDYSQGSVLSSKSDLSAPHEATQPRFFEKTLKTKGKVSAFPSFTSHQTGALPSPPREHVFSRHVASRTNALPDGTMPEERQTESTKQNNRLGSTEARKSEVDVNSEAVSPSRISLSQDDPTPIMGVKITVSTFDPARERMSSASKEGSKDTKSPPSVMNRVEMPHDEQARCFKLKGARYSGVGSSPTLYKDNENEDNTAKSQRIGTIARRNQFQECSTKSLTLTDETSRGEEQGSQDDEMSRSESRQSYFIKKGKLRAQRRRMERSNPFADVGPSPAPSEVGDIGSVDVEQIIHSPNQISSEHPSPPRRNTGLGLNSPTKPVRAHGPQTSRDLVGVCEAGQSDALSFFSHAGSAFSSVTSPSTNGHSVVNYVAQQELARDSLPSKRSTVAADDYSGYTQPPAPRKIAVNPDDYQRDDITGLAGRYHTSSRFLDSDVHASRSLMADNSTDSSAQHSSNANSTYSSGSSRCSDSSGASGSAVDTAIEETFKRQRQRHRRKRGSSKAERAFQEELSQAFQDAYSSFGIKKLSKDVSESVRALDLQQLKTGLNEGIQVASESFRRLVDNTPTFEEPNSSTTMAKPATTASKRGDARSYEGVAIEVEYVSDSDDGSEPDRLYSVNTGGEFERDDSLCQDASFRSDIFSLGETTNGGSTTTNSLVFLGQVRLSSMQS